MFIQRLRITHRIELFSRKGRFEAGSLHRAHLHGTGMTAIAAFPTAVEPPV